MQVFFVCRGQRIAKPNLWNAFSCLFRPVEAHAICSARVKTVANRANFCPVLNLSSKRANVRPSCAFHASDSPFGSELESYLLCNACISGDVFLVSNVLARPRIVRVSSDHEWVRQSQIRTDGILRPSRIATPFCMSYREFFPVRTSVTANGRTCAAQIYR